MDRYSYDPNSRIARRIKERERRKRRRRRNILIFILVVVLAAAAYGVFRYVGTGSGLLKQFNPQEGFHRLMDTIKGEEAVSAPAPTPDTDEEKEPASTPAPTQAPAEDEPSDEVQASSAGVYPASTENNNLLDIFKNAEGETEKVCALTFDDGPNKASTLKILDALEENDVKATFFMTGEQISYNKDIAKQVHSAGHLIANHTYTQNYDIVYKSWENFYDEVQRTDALISEVTAEQAYKLVRLPGGSHTATKKEYCKKLAQQGYYYIDWSLIAEGGESIPSQVKENTGSNSVVILMEERNLTKNTDEILGAVIDDLKSKGYIFKRLDEICYYEETEAPVQDISVLPDPLDIFEERGYIR